MKPRRGGILHRESTGQGLMLGYSTNERPTLYAKHLTVQGFHFVWYCVSSKLRRRRSLISAQGSSNARTLGHDFKLRRNPVRVRRLANPFRVQLLFDVSDPRVLAMLGPWAEISERLRRNSNRSAYS